MRAGLISGNLDPWVRLYGPDGTFLGGNAEGSAGEVAVQATESGTFTVVIGDGSQFRELTGDYRLTLAKTGSPIVVSPQDEGGPMTNGVMHTGAIDVGDLDVWSFTAQAGQALVVRTGIIAGSGNLDPWVRLYGPDGVELGQNAEGSAGEVAVQATESGTFTVIISDGSQFRELTGDYRLTLAQTGNPIVVSPQDEGGPMTNGVMHTGAIDVGDLDVWSFTAQAGQAIVVRAGLISGNLDPWVRLYGPDGTFLGGNAEGSAGEVAVQATESGTFTVVIGDGSQFRELTGDYRLTLAKTGSPIVVSPQDEGGPMTNGVMHTGAIDVGDLDVWSFTAQAGEALVVRTGIIAGSGNLDPWVRLYGPDGVELGGNREGSAGEVAVQATESGTFTVIISDGSQFLDLTGDYRLTLAKTGSPVEVSPGDEGGPMTGIDVYDGTIDIGDLDVWSFTAFTGNTISINVTDLVSGSPLYPWIRLYGRDGTLLKSVSGAPTVGFVMSAPATGSYLVVVGDGSQFRGNSGTYAMTVNGLSDAWRVGIPSISGAKFHFNEVGGTPNATFVLLTTTNLAKPANLWTPVLTNQFDQFGVFSYTNTYNPVQRQQFYRFTVAP